MDGDLLWGVVWVGDFKNFSPSLGPVLLGGASLTEMPVLEAGPDLLLSLITRARAWAWLAEKMWVLTFTPSVELSEESTNEW